MCIKRQKEDEETVQRVPPRRAVYPPTHLFIDTHSHLQRSALDKPDPMYVFPIYPYNGYPWPPKNPPWIHLPPLPETTNYGSTLTTPVSPTIRERPRLYSLQEFLNEDPDKTLKSIKRQHNEI